MAEGKWAVQVSIYGMNKSQGQKVHHWEYSQWYCDSVVWGQRVAMFVVSPA